MIYYEKIGRKRIKVPKYITDAKRIETSIKRGKLWLRKMAMKYGLWENFGRNVVLAINDKFIDISSYTNEMNRNRKKLKEFDEWCLTFSGYNY